jgi:putative tricarboxylic transport membrane protein
MSRSDSITNLIVIALGVFVAYHSHAVLKLGILISPGAGFLPFLCGIALIALGVVWRLQGWLRKPRPNAKAADMEDVADATGAALLPETRTKLVLAFLTTVAYAVLFERIGFLLATLVFMLGWQLVVERERWLKAVIVTALCAAAMFALFRLLLRVELPPNPLLS